MRVKKVSTSTVGPSSAMKSPNWLEMPDELMSNIFQRFYPDEILKSTWKVCTTWRRICKDPAMWKAINLSYYVESVDTSYNLDMMTKLAVNLSCGEAIDIRIGSYCTDELLYHVVLQSSKLKRLCLWYCDLITCCGLTRALERLSQLEELESAYIYFKKIHIEIIGRNCPQLKSFKILCMPIGRYTKCDDQAVAIANNMPELRHLQLHGSKMTNTGVQAILNGCPHLESLHLHMYRSFNLDKSLVEKCMERIKDFEHNSPRNSHYSDDSSSGSDVDESSEDDD